MMLTRRICLSIALLSSLTLGYSQSSFDVIHWSTFKSGTQSKITGSYRRVLNNEAEFQSYWAQAMGEPPYAAPKGIDWIKEELIAIHIGERRSGGFSVVVDTIKRTRAAEITVFFAEETPQKGSMNTQAITSPWVLVRMDRTAGNIQFEGSKRVARTGILVRGHGCGCCSRCTCSVGPWEEITPAHREINTSGRGYDSDVWWKSFEQGPYSRINTFGFTVIRSLNELNAFWMRHTGSNRDLYDEDPIDFRREQLVAVNLGLMPSSGYRLAIDSLERTGLNTVTIRYTVIYPGRQQPFGAQMASPFAIFRTDRSRDGYVLVRRNFLPTIDAGSRCFCGCSRCYGR